MMQFHAPAPTRSFSPTTSQSLRPRSLAHRLRVLPLWVGLGALVGCAVGPNYHRPPAVVTPVYKENQGWVPATPREIPSSQPWWSIYDDPVLDGLERQVVVSNQTLKESLAAYYSAQQQIAIDRGTFFPAVTLSASATKTGGPAGVSTTSTGAAVAHSKSTETIYSVGPQATWTLDVWGRIQRTVESDVAKAQASAADVAAALLSAQISLAEDYFQMRAAEQQVRIYNTYIADLENALEIVENQVAAGTDTLADVYAAQTQLETTQVSAINEQLTRATYEHAIAVLTGKAPQQLSIPQGTLSTTIPVVPVGLPSELLQRRPDIAAAERTVASANALIGVAESAWFPSLTLSGAYSFDSTAVAGLLSPNNALWSFGPTIAEDVFNGGATLATTRQARANYDQAVATYRQTVLSAFQSVENDLVTLRVLEESDALNVTAVEAARLSEELYLNQYKAGIVAYSSVITAQTTRLAAEITLLGIQTQQLVTSVDLVSQIGGGWSTQQFKLRERGVPVTAVDRN
jgi:NodT family efflux transporter outer membrane factor (OMF) lipoprotein